MCGCQLGMYISLLFCHYVNELNFLKIKNVCLWPAVLRKLNLSVLEYKIPQKNSEACRNKCLNGLILIIYCDLNFAFKHCGVILLRVKYEQKHDLQTYIQRHTVFPMAS